MKARAFVALAAAICALSAGIAHRVALHLATATVAAARWPYLPGSRLPLRVDGIAPPYGTALLGPGSIRGGIYQVGERATAGTAFLVVGNAAGLGSLRLRLAGPPPRGRRLLLVASYDDGLVVHDAGTFAVDGVLATGGVPSDVAAAAGRIAVTDTQGDALTEVRFFPWAVASIAGVPTADEIAVDAAARAFFVTDRDVGGEGALTRIGFDGSVVRALTGVTAEGLAIDVRRRLVYVANVNDGSVAVVDARTMHVVGRFPAVERVFSLALSPDGSRLYAVSNEAADSPLRRAGRVVAIALRPHPHVVAASAALAFPLGVALDWARRRLFVSDESQRTIYVLDALTLRARRAPLRTCAIPWKLTLDSASERLYVPCAGENAVDAFDLRGLHRIAGAPFATGGYPLAIAVWPQ